MVPTPVVFQSSNILNVTVKQFTDHKNAMSDEECDKNSVRDKLNGNNVENEILDHLDHDYSICIVKDKKKNPKSQKTVYFSAII